MPSFPRRLESSPTAASGLESLGWAAAWAAGVLVEYSALEKRDFSEKK